MYIVAQCVLKRDIYFFCEGLSHGGLKGLLVYDYRRDDLCVSTNNVVACDASFLKSRIQIC